MMDNTFTFTVVLTREELRTNGPSVVGMSFYNLGAAVFEWGGERNKDENGIPAARIHGHHAAQRVAQHAVAEWMGWSNPLEDDLTLANDRIHEMSLVNADLRARLLPALDAAGVRYDDPPEALAAYIKRKEEEVERLAGGIAILPNQPPPTPGSGDVWQHMIETLSAEGMYSDLVPAMRERRELGIARYGTPLQIHNGRNHRIDAMQELLDAAVYLWAAGDVSDARRCLFLASALLRRVGGRGDSGGPL